MAPPWPGLPQRLNSKESACQCRRPKFNPWVGKIPWRRKQQAHSSILAWKSHGQRSLVGCSTWSFKRVGLDWVTKQWKQQPPWPGRAGPSDPTLGFLPPKTLFFTHSKGPWCLSHSPRPPGSKWPVALIALLCVESSQIRDQTHVPRTGSLTLIHCTTKEVLIISSYKDIDCIGLRPTLMTSLPNYLFKTLSPNIVTFWDSRC